MTFLVWYFPRIVQKSVNKRTWQCVNEMNAPTNRSCWPVFNICKLKSQPLQPPVNQCQVWTQPFTSLAKTPTTHVLHPHHTQETSVLRSSGFKSKIKNPIHTSFTSHNNPSPTCHLLHAEKAKKKAKNKWGPFPACTGVKRRKEWWREV